MESRKAKVDYYKILGLKRDATVKDIKDAYRKAVMKYHPDITKDKSTEEVLKLVNEAYFVLSDPKRRKEYDENNKSFYVDIDKDFNSVKKSVESVIRSLKSNVKVIVSVVSSSLQKMFVDRFTMKLSNEELLQRVAYSDNDLVKINALRIISSRKQRACIPYLLEILKFDGISDNIKDEIRKTIKLLGYNFYYEISKY